MTAAELENLVRIGELKHEPPSRAAFETLRRPGEARLADATRMDLSLEGRAYQAYNEPQALSLGPHRATRLTAREPVPRLRVLPHTLGLGAPGGVLARCHEAPNVAEYEGDVDMDERSVVDLVAAAKAVRNALRSVEPPPPK